MIINIKYVNYASSFLSNFLKNMLIDWVSRVWNNSATLANERHLLVGLILKHLLSPAIRGRMPTTTISTVRQQLAGQRAPWGVEDAALYFHLLRKWSILLALLAIEEALIALCLLAATTSSSSSWWGMLLVVLRWANSVVALRSPPIHGCLALPCGTIRFANCGWLVRIPTYHHHNCLPWVMLD